jgi:DNA modification methylase
VQCFWGGNHFELPVSRGWLVWNKPERNFTLSEAELCWTSKDMAMRVFDYRRSDPDRTHPTQKPVLVMAWTMDKVKVPKGAIVLDPYMGSGTTGVACMNTDRKFIGIERERVHFDIACERIDLAQQQGKLF